jgi:hypothetical protein
MTKMYLSRKGNIKIGLHNYKENTKQYKNIVFWEGQGGGCSQLFPDYHFSRGVLEPNPGNSDCTRFSTSSTGSLRKLTASTEK